MFNSYVKYCYITIGYINNYWLVILTILKYMKVNGKDCPIYQ